MLNRPLYRLFIAISSIVFLSCGKETDPNPEEVEIDFEITVDNEKAPATVTITNNTTGATFYKWTFTGGDPASSTMQNPESITYSDAGDYTIILEASNGSGIKRSSRTFSLEAPLAANFGILLFGSSAPAEVNINNMSTGANTYSWSFEGGEPASSTEKNPGPVSYTNIGEYTISLEVSDGIESETISKNFSLNEELTSDFEISVSSDNAPAEVTVTNNSTGATSYNWTFTGGDPANSTDENPSIINYSENGDYTIELAASNGTATISSTKSFSLQASEITNN